MTFILFNLLFYPFFTLHSFVFLSLSLLQWFYLLLFDVCSSICGQTLKSKPKSSLEKAGTTWRSLSTTSTTRWSQRTTRSEEAVRLGFRIERKPARRRRSSSSSAFVALSRLAGFETRRRSRLFWLGMGEEGFGAVDGEVGGAEVGRGRGHDSGGRRRHSSATSFGRPGISSENL